MNGHGRGRVHGHDAAYAHVNGHGRSHEHICGCVRVRLWACARHVRGHWHGHGHERVLSAGNVWSWGQDKTQCSPNLLDICRTYLIIVYCLIGLAYLCMCCFVPLLLGGVAAAK